MDFLKTFIIEFNDYHVMDDEKSEIEFILVGGNGFAQQQGSSSKSCSESYYVILSTELYKTFGDNFVINGITNFVFYPFEKGIQNEYVLDYPDREVIDFNSHYTVTIPCCNSCKENKFDSLEKMKSAQKTAQENSDNTVLARYTLNEPSLARSASLFPRKRELDPTSTLLDSITPTNKWQKNEERP